MRFSLAFAKRPVLALSVNCIIVIMGLVALRHIELRHQPMASLQEIQIGTLFYGANSHIVENRVTKPIEEVLVGLDGIKSISSDSEDGWSRVFLKGKLGGNQQFLSQVRDRITSVLPMLPTAVKRPFIWESGEESKAILGVAFQDTQRSQAMVSDYVRRSVYDQLALIDGVGEIRFYGNLLYQIEIRLDPAKMAEQQLTVSAVLEALKKEKLLASGGELETVSGKQPVVLTTTLTRPEEMRDWTIKFQDGIPIKVRDIAEVSIADIKPDYRIQIEGKPVVGLDIIAKPLANPLEVASQVKSFIQSLQKMLPKTMQAFVFYDVTPPFYASLKAVKSSLWEAIILVAIIIWLSLSSWRGAVISMVTVPICLIGTFILLWVFHFSINPMTLLALVLAVGLVVDDAIVVIENVHKHQTEENLSPLTAVKKSMKEISFAVLVMTVTLAAVYLPIAFQTNESTLIFREFAWTLAGSVLFSGVVALTLTPALCGKFLTTKKSDSVSNEFKSIETKSEALWQSLENKYQVGLEKVLGHKRKLVASILFIFILGVLAYTKLPIEFMPIEDEDILQGYIGQTTNRVLPDVQKEWKDTILQLTQNIPERVRLVMYQWKEMMWWQLHLKPRLERTRDAKTIAGSLQKELAVIPGPMIGVDVLAPGMFSEDEGIKVILQYTGDYGYLLEAARNIIRDLSEDKRFERSWSRDTEEVSRLQLSIDQPLASLAGVSMETIEDTLSSLISGKKAIDFPFQGLDYEVMLRSEEQSRNELESLNRFFVIGGEGQWIPLGSLMQRKEVLEPVRLKRYNRLRAVTLHVSPKPDLSLNQAMAVVEPVVLKHLPEGARYQWGGQLEKYQEARHSMALTFGLALLFIFFVLSALFESFIDPFIVLLTVPLSLVGGIMMVYAMNGSSNIYTQIGLITLIGLITKHGILITDFANRLRLKGYGVKDAVIMAARARLRPVLMTTLAMVGGAIPLMFSMGAGAMARRHIGWVVVGGMLSGTFFSLFIVPLVYVGISRLKKHEKAGTV